VLEYPLTSDLTEIRILGVNKAMKASAFSYLETAGQPNLKKIVTKNRRSNGHLIAVPKLLRHLRNNMAQVDLPRVVARGQEW